MLAKKLFLILSILLLIILISSISGTAEARSVHAVTGHPDNMLEKHKIQGNQLEYQMKTNITNYGAGVPTIFGVDSASGELVNFSPWTGTEIKRMNLPSISLGDTDIGLAGSRDNELYYINGDDDSENVYVLDPLDASIIRQFRITHGHHVNGLGYQSGTPDSYIYTSGCELGDMHRYAAQDGATPIYYWGNSVSVHDAVGGDDYGRIFAPETGTGQIVEVDPFASQVVNHIPCTFEDKIVGMAYDGMYLYASTLDNRVYVINADTGEVINETQMGYILYALAAIPNPCPVFFEKTDDVNDGDCVGPGDRMTYSICYDANGYADTNVVITDILPPEVNYVSSDPCGSYDANHNIVTWNIDFPSDACGCVELVVHVNATPESNGIITNSCEIKGDCIDLFAEEKTYVGPVGDFTGEEGVPDCEVNFQDLDIMAGEWLDSNDIQTDLYEDGTIDFRDYAKLAENWLEDTRWPPE